MFYEPGDVVKCWYCNTVLVVLSDGTLPVHSNGMGYKCSQSGVDVVNPPPEDEEIPF